jgi:cellulose synthase (UDP-forming)
MEQDTTTQPLLATISTDRLQISKGILVVNIALACLYFIAITFWFPRGPLYFYVLLIVGEVFHFWQALTYLYTIWDTKTALPPRDPNYLPAVDVFITVAGEPLDIIEETAQAALHMDYPHFRVYLLNDGYVAKKDNWQEVEALAERLGIMCITRTIPGGAKSGNINHGLSKTFSPLVAVFDADHVPHADFLKKMVGYFADPNVGFVQSPQYYKNQQLNPVTAAAWEQQELFFVPICKGKQRLNAAFMCGTNMVIRRQTLMQVGGMCETNIAEDFLTSLFIHERGWKSVYVPEVLAEGLAPEDFLSYYKQQFRWARGSLEVIFKYNPLFRRGLTWPQKIQYLASSSYYLSGIVVLLNAIFPLIFFYTGQVPLTISTMALAAVFLPYIFLMIYTLQRSSHFSYTYRAVAFSLSSFPIHIQAALGVLFNRKATFHVTAKRQLSGNFMSLVIPHLAYLVLVTVGVGVAVLREGVNASVVANLCWSLFNVAVFIPFISAALPEWQVKPAASSVIKEA